jgi:hypothetical protein
MKKNVVFWIAVQNNDPHIFKKHGGFKYFEYSKKTWQYWCNKNDVVFFHYDKCSNEDIVTHKPTWQRWFDVFDTLESNNIDYNKICVVDSAAMIKWDTPNFFEMCPSGELTAFRSLENLRWISQSSDGYKSLFPDVNVNMNKYINCGLQIFDKSHKPFLKKLTNFYFDNFNDIMKLQNEVVRKGTDQPVYNYFLQKENVNLKFNLPVPYHLTHLARFDWFSHNWQLKKDKTPFFIKYGYIWSFSGFPDRSKRYDIMKQTWDLVKNNYE